MSGGEGSSREIYAAANEEQVRPPWDLNEEVTVYSRKNKNRKGAPAEFEGRVTHIGEILNLNRKTEGGKYVRTRARYITVVYKNAYHTSAPESTRVLRWYEGETVAKDTQGFWIEANVSDQEAPIID